MGLWAICSSCRCPCSVQGSWTRQPLKVPSNSNDSVILWFSELLDRKTELRMREPGRVGWRFASYSSFSLPKGMCRCVCNSKLHHWAELTAAAQAQLFVHCVDGMPCCCHPYQLDRHANLIFPLFVHCTRQMWHEAPLLGTAFCMKKAGQIMCLHSWMEMWQGWFVEVKKSKKKSLSTTNLNSCRNHQWILYRRICVNLASITQAEKDP